MHDVAISLNHQPGNLATMGEAVGRAGLNLEGGGCFPADGRGIAHFLFDDGFAAQRVLEAAGLEVTAVREVLFHRLNQGRPGELGRFCRMLAEGGINIEVMYSDHGHRLVLVVDNLQQGRILEEQWRQKN